MKGSSTIYTISQTGDQDIDGVLMGYKWGQSITYAFPDAGTDYSYRSDLHEPTNGFSQLSSALQNVFKFAIEQDYGNTANDGFSVEGFTNLSATATTDEAHANIRAANSDQVGVSGTAAYTYDLTNTPADTAGDMWFDTTDWLGTTPGTFGYRLIMHEMGHALGLKHGHTSETNSTGTWSALPSNHDGSEWSVMTYHGYPGDTSTADDGAPAQTWMMDDISALQTLYGADYTTNSGNTTYSWAGSGDGRTYVNGVAAWGATNSNDIFMTIWDGGGNDTYDFSAYSSIVEIALAPGSSSVIHNNQNVYLGGGANNYADNVYNARLFQNNTASMIENAIGGSGDDIITGNSIGNSLQGNAGNDTLTGYDSGDTLNGNSGDDELNGNAGYDNLYGGDGYDHIYGGDGNDYLDGGQYLDLLTGGNGVDTFAFNKVSSTSNSDFVADFVDGTDLLKVTGTGLSSWSQLSVYASDVYGDCVISLGGGNQFTIENTLKSQLSGADFSLIN